MILSARHIPKQLEESHLYIRVTALDKCPSMRLITRPVKCSGSELPWNQGFSFEAEISTEGLRLELMSYSGQTLEKLNPAYHSSVSKARAICLGELSVTWKSVLDGSSLSCTSWSTFEQKVQHEPKDYMDSSITCFIVVESAVVSELHS